MTLHRACWLGYLMALVAAGAPAQDPPREWLDASTGHRVVRLSDEPGTASLY